MRRAKYPILFALGCNLVLMSAPKAVAAGKPVNVAGVWEMTRESRRGMVTRTLTIEQHGSKIKGIEKWERGEAQFEGSVTDNKIRFVVKRDTPRGTFTFDYSGTVEGDSMQGTFHSARYDGKWNAKRTAPGSEK